MTQKTLFSALALSMLICSSSTLLASHLLLDPEHVSVAAAAHSSAKTQAEHQKRAPLRINVEETPEDSPQEDEGWRSLAEARMSECLQAEKALRAALEEKQRQQEASQEAKVGKDRNVHIPIQAMGEHAEIPKKAGIPQGLS